MPNQTLNVKPHIAVLTRIYPSSGDPALGVFTRVLARNFVQLGVSTTVIVPTKFWKPDANSFTGQMHTTDDSEASVIRPAYLPFSNKRLPGLGSTFSWSVKAFEKAVRRSLLRLATNPTHIYGQFLFPAGRTAGWLSKETGAKSVVDLGESYLSFYEKHLGLDEVKRAINEVDRIVAVADHLRDKCINRYGVPEHKVATFKNAAFVENGPLDKVHARKQLGLPLDRKIVGFVGTFDENKRPRYVLDALRQRPDIGAFFLGRQGTQTPVGKQVYFAGAVPHEKVPVWLSAADIFVHASLTEMSANAIAEAQACGLPTVATDIPGNREMLDSECAIFVAPRDQDMLSNAIFQLMDDPKRRTQMSKAALASAQRYTSLDRARNILSWILS